MVISEKIDLGLHIPDGFAVKALFPEDRLLRLHPNWFVSDFKKKKDAFTVRLKDYATEKNFPLSGRIAYNGSRGELLNIELNGDFDSKIRFFFKKSSLFVQIHSPEEIESTDPILLWIKAIKEYIRIYVKKTPAAVFFRLLMNRMILQMNPSQRKICLMLARFTALEILVILLILVGYVLFVL
jgi:hypothetical protein